MFESISENKFKPYQYDIEKFMNGTKDCYMVSHLLKAKKGNCRSLPYLYKILANELNAEAFLAVVPMHIYIKHRGEEGSWWNLETTSGTFSRSSFIMETFNVSEEAIRSGLFMKALSDTESVAYCLYDLIDFYKGYGELSKYPELMSEFQVMDSTIKYISKLGYTTMNPETYRTMFNEVREKQMRLKTGKE